MRYAFNLELSESKFGQQTRSYMTRKGKFKTVSLDEMIGKHIDKLGTVRRDAFEKRLRNDLLGGEFKSRTQ